MNEFEIQVDKESEGIRLDTFLKNSFPDISRASIQKAIRGGSCKIDDKITIQPSAKIRTGQKITFKIFPPLGCGGASLVYKVSSSTARATQRNPVLKFLPRDVKSWQHYPL